MSGNHITTGLPAIVLKRKIIRYAFGMFLVSVIAFGISWPVSYLSIVLVNSLLLGKHISFKAGINFLMKVIIAVFFAMLVSTYLLQYQLIFTLLVGLIFLLLFYAKDSELSPLLKTWLLVSILLIPLLSIQDLTIGELTSWALILGTGIAIIVTWIAQGLFPDKEFEGANKQEPAAQVKIPPTPHERYVAAVKRTAVVYPVVLLFYYFEWHSSALILIYIGLYSSFPGFAKDLTVGKSLLVGCLTGGVIALILYEVVVLVPHYGFFLVLVFGLTLWAGSEILGGGKYANQIKAGISTIIIIFGSAVGNDDVDAGGQVLTRVIQVATVVVYLVLAFGLIEKLFPERSLATQNLANINE